MRASGRLHRLELDLLPLSFAIARLGPDDPVPNWSTRGTFHSQTRTSDELSVVCEASSVPKEIQAERGFRCLRVRGTLSFSETGILVALARPLAEASVSVFALSTYDTDYLLVHEDNLKLAIRSLTEAGHRVIGVANPPDLDR